MINLSNEHPSLERNLNLMVTLKSCLARKGHGRTQRHALFSVPSARGDPCTPPRVPCTTDIQLTCSACVAYAKVFLGSMHSILPLKSWKQGSVSLQMLSLCVGGGLLGSLMVSSRIPHHGCWLNLEQHSAAS